MKHSLPCTLLFIATVAFNGCGSPKTNTIFDSLSVGVGDSANTHLYQDYYYVDSTYEGRLERFTILAPSFIDGIRGVLVAYSLGEKVVRYDWYLDSIAMWLQPIDIDSIDQYTHATQGSYDKLVAFFTDACGTPETSHENGVKIAYWEDEGITIRYLDHTRSLAITKADIAPLPGGPHSHRYRSVVVDSSLIATPLGFDRTSFLRDKKEAVESEKIVHFIKYGDAQDSAFTWVTVRDTAFGMPGKGMYTFNPQGRCVTIMWHGEDRISKSLYDACFGLIERQLGPSVGPDPGARVHPGEIVRYWITDTIVTFTNYSIGEFMFSKTAAFMRERQPSRREDFITDEE